jgi:hypothetical protein
MRCVIIVLVVVAACALQHYVIYPSLAPIYRKVRFEEHMARSKLVTHLKTSILTFLGPLTSEFWAHDEVLRQCDQVLLCSTHWIEPYGRNQLLW